MTLNEKLLKEIEGRINTGTITAISQVLDRLAQEGIVVPMERVNQHWAEYTLMYMKHKVNEEFVKGVYMYIARENLK